MSEYSKISTQLRSRPARPVLAVLLGTVLVGCTGSGSGTGVSHFEPTYLRMTGEHEFGQALRRHYLELATNAFDRGDTKRSDFYSLRALMAAEGKLAHPGVQSGGGELAAASTRLSQLLRTGARTGSPDLAARAQAAFDCWLLESGSGGESRIADACRYNAMNALAELESASTGAQLAVAGGPTTPEPQSYVVEAGESRTIKTPDGYTIEIMSEQVEAAPLPAHVPAGHTTTELQFAPQMIDTGPLVQEFAAPTIAPLAPLPVETIPTTTIAMAPPPPAPVSVIDLGSINAQPVPFAPLAPASTIQTVPVFDTEPIQSLPSIELSPLPLADGGDAARALIDANLNRRGDFSVFFGFDSDEVTLEAEDVLIDAVQGILLSGTKRVTLLGFTDSMGDARYNQLLAMRRAQSVRKFLQKKVGNAVTFEILPIGEIQAVQTGGDGVIDALNRKVQINLQ